jgi:integrase
MDTQMLLPKGITMNKTKTSFRIQTRKNVMVNGKKDKLKDFRTVKIHYPPNASPEQRLKTFNEALEEAKKEKLLAIAMLSNGTVTKQNLKVIRAVGTLKTTYDTLYEERWKHSETGHNRNIDIFANDVFSYFPSDIRLDDMQTHEYYNGFVAHMRKRIVERDANHMGHVSNRTINKRLGLLRDIFRYGIAHGLLDQSKLLNPDIRLSHMGWENLKVKTIKSKMAMTKSEERMILDLCRDNGYHEFANALIWLVDTGMRHSTEFLKFTIDDVDFKRNIVHFHRPKTNVNTKVPLTPRAREIVLNLKDRANMREDKRVFGHFTKRQLRTMFDKLRELSGLALFTPYITRHTFMTKLGKNKEVPAVIANLAGVTIETAQKYYTHSNDEMQVNAIANLNGNEDEDEKSLIGHNSKGLI